MHGAFSFPERKREEQMLKALEKHQELEQRMQAMQQSYAEKLREHEDKRFYTTQDMKRTYDHSL